MNIKDLFLENFKLNKEKYELKKKIAYLDDKKKKLIDKCCHELLFLFNDDTPRKRILIGKLYCPICDNIINVYDSYDNLDKYNNSIILDLTNKNIELNRNILSTIKISVFSNLDFYYDKKIDNIDKEEKITDVIEINSKVLKLKNK